MLGKQYSYMPKNEIRTFSKIIYNNKLKMVYRPKCKTGYYKAPRVKQAEHSLT